MLEQEFDFVVTDIHTIAERQPNPDWSISNFMNPQYFVLGLALSGESIYEVDGMVYQIREGDCVFFQKGQLHSARSTDDNPWTFITVAFDALSLQNSSPLHLPLPSVILNVQEHTKKLFVALTEGWLEKQVGYLLLCRALIQEILFALVQLNHQRNYEATMYERVNLARHFIIENYMQTITAEDLAKIAGCSESHLRKLFRSVMGIPATQYINTVRIQKAKDLLLTGDVSVSEVYAKVGFPNIQYFSYMFKKILGVPPSVICKMEESHKKNASPSQE